MQIYLRLQDRPGELLIKNPNLELKNIFLPKHIYVLSTYPYEIDEIIKVLNQFDSSALTFNEVSVELKSLKDFFYFEKVSNRANLVRLEIGDID